MKSPESSTDVLLRATRDADDPTDEQLLRVRHSLMEKIAVGGAVAAGLGAVSTSATGASSTGLLLKLSLLPMSVKVSLSVAVLGLGALGSWKWAASAGDHRPPVEASRMGERPDETKPPALPEAVPPTTMSPQEQASEVGASGARESALQLPPRHVTRSGPHQAAVSGPELQEEARLLAEVQGALGRGLGPQALDKLNEYYQRFPAGVLRAEADAARVFALCQSGRRADAQAASRRFLRRYPSSPSAARVQQACAEGSP